MHFFSWHYLAFIWLINLIPCHCSLSSPSSHPSSSLHLDSSFFLASLYPTSFLLIILSNFPLLSLHFSFFTLNSFCQIHWGSLVGLLVKNLPAMQETQDWPLGQEALLEKGMATQSSVLAWGIPWTEEPGRLQSLGSQRVGHNWGTKHVHFFIHSYFNLLSTFPPAHHIDSWKLWCLNSRFFHIVEFL